MLKGMVGLVTGAASGMGKGTALHCAEQGARLALCDLKDSLGAEVASFLGPRAVFSPCDISSEEDVQSALSLCKEKFGRLDFVVNCAGLARAFKLYNLQKNSTISDEEFEILIKPNVYGAFNIARLASAAMSENEPNEHGQRGVIIFRGGPFHYDGNMGQILLGAASGAVNSMVLPLSRDLASLGIRVASVSPSFIDSPLISEAVLTKVVQEFYKHQVHVIKRFGTPEEFARTVQEVLLNPMINGTEIRITSAFRHFYTN